MTSANRRQFLRAAGVSLFSYSVAGLPELLTPRDARAREAALEVLTRAEAGRLEAVCEAFAPGAAEAGIAWYVDHQLARPANESLLMAKYFNVEPPYAPFYRASLDAIDGLGIARYGKRFEGLDADAAATLLRELLAGSPEDWQGPPALLSYLVLRNDAVDVVYGTVDGFRRLGVPYMAHIMPPRKW